jgi:hypothetical protein
LPRTTILTFSPQLFSHVIGCCIISAVETALLNLKESVITNCVIIFQFNQHLIGVNVACQVFSTSFETVQLLVCRSGQGLAIALKEHACVCVFWDDYTAVYLALAIFSL